MTNLPRLLDYAGARDVRDLGTRVAETMRDIVAYLTGQPKLHLRVLDVSSLPVSIRVEGLTRPPAGVLLMGAQLASNPGAVVNAYGVHWQWTSAGEIELTSVGGLTSGLGYKLSLLVIEA